MKGKLSIGWLACLLGAVLVSALGAQEGVSVEKMVFCTSIEDREPAGADTAFAPTTEQVYCFTKIMGAADTTAVTHVWFYEDKEMARVELPVRSKSWRTWSSKKLLAQWTGKWRVDVLLPDGAVIASKEFKVE